MTRTQGRPVSFKTTDLNEYNFNNEKDKKEKKENIKREKKNMKEKKDKNIKDIKNIKSIKNINEDIKFATLNVSNISGKIHLIERFVSNLGIDFIYINEAGVAPGAYPLTEHIVFQVGHERKEGAGRYPYGHILLRNPLTTTLEHFIPIVTTDPFIMAFKFRGRVFCGVYVKPLDCTMMTEMLGRMSQLLNVHQEIIFLGDFNARHKSFGDHASNQQGLSLLMWMQENGYQRAAPTSREAFTFITNRGRSIPDHIVHPEKVEVDAEVDIDSAVGDCDHRPLIGRTLPVSEERYQRNIFRGWNLRKLKEEETIVQVTEFLTENEAAVVSTIDEISNSTDLESHVKVDQVNQVVTKVLTDCLERLVGKTVKKFKRRPFLSEALTEKEKRCQFLYETWRTATNSESRDSLWDEYMGSRKALAKEIKRAKGEKFQEFCNVTNRQDSSEMIKTLNAISKARKRRLPVGLSNFPEKLDEYADHFQHIYNNDLPTVPDRLIWTRCITNNEPCDLTINTIDVLAALKELPKGKAVGIDNIPNEILKVAPFPMANILVAAFSLYTRLKMVPKLWTVSVIKPVIKKGDPSLISNYRPISLSVTMRRLFEKIMLPRVCRVIEPLHKSQNGFRTSRGCLDAVASLNEEVIQNRKAGKTTHMIFLDIKAAYDSVDRGTLWSRLATRGMATNMIQMLVSLFADNKSIVSVEGSTSKEIRLHHGLLQGSLLSPVLYSAFIDEAAHIVESNYGRKAQPARLLMYADDMVLFGTNPTVIQDALNDLVEFAAESRFQFNIKKCEVISTAKFFIHNEELPACENFKYLGVMVNEDGVNWSLHYEYRRKEALKKIAWFRELGFNGNGFNLQTNSRIAKAFIQPVADYGIQICPLKKDRLVLDKAFREMMKASVSFSKSCPTDTLCVLTGIDTPEMRYEKLAFQFYRKLERLSRDSFAVKEAFLKHQKSPCRKSSFHKLEENWYLDQLRRARFKNVKRGLSATELRDLWRARKESFYERTAERMVSAHIFKNKTIAAIENFRKTLSKFILLGQRALLRWILNRRNPKKKCPKCQKEDMKKSHMEQCVLNDHSEYSGFNSRVEKRLSTINFNHDEDLKAGLESAIRAVRLIESVELRA